jgi:ABC-type dipeptide/oligopeptide/nickel transport system permease component
MTYVARRLIYSVFVVFSVLTVSFFLVRLTGDPASHLLSLDATQDEIMQTRKELGLDQPVYIQYFKFIKKGMKGDFGMSIRYQQSAFMLVIERIPATLELTAVAFTFMVLLGLPLGILASIKKDSTIDLFSSGAALFGQSVPTFWLGLVLILLFAVRWPLLPSSGHRGFISLILPGVTLGAFSASLVARMTRSSLLEVLNSHYITTARAKGLSERTVILKHSLRNAAIPILTIIGLQVGPLFGGAVIVEQVFAFPGMGRLVVQAIFNRDFPIVQTFVVVVSALIVLVNLIVDILYLFLDPRVTYD